MELFSEAVARQTCGALPVPHREFVVGQRALWAATGYFWDTPEGQNV